MTAVMLLANVLMLPLRVIAWIVGLLVTTAIKTVAVIATVLLVLAIAYWAGFANQGGGIP